jgi:hypothetical protein
MVLATVITIVNYVYSTGHRAQVFKVLVEKAKNEKKDQK